MSDWKFGFEHGIKGEWPRDENGEFVEPKFLEHIGGSISELEMERNMLMSFGIPSVCKYPNDGDFGNLIFGRPGNGMELFVPVTLYEDALNIINCDMSDAGFENTEESPEE